MAGASGSCPTFETLTERQDLRELFDNTEPQLIDPGCKFAVEIYHLFSAYAAVSRLVILPVAMLNKSDLLRRG